MLTISRLTATVLTVAVTALVPPGCSPDREVPAESASTAEASEGSSPAVEVPQAPTAVADPQGAARDVLLPPAGAGFDYQLGGAYTPAPGVSIVGRDRTDEPAGLGYDICYINGFQTQPDESATFAAQRPELLLQGDGGPLVDENWPDEYIYDTSTAEKRAALAAVVQPWIAGCAAAGYHAVEIDNLDSYTRSGSLLTADDNIALAQEYARLAHDAGLAIAQKNTVEESARLRQAGYDFAMTESCYNYEECAGYLEQYPVVLDVEYTDELGEDDFAAACADPARPATTILRDHDLTTPGDPGYAYSSCAD